MTDSPLSSTKARLLFTAWMLIMASMQVYGLYGFGWQIAFLDAGLTHLLTTLASLFTIQSLRFYGPSRTQLAFLVVWSLILTGLLLLIEHHTLGAIFYEYKPYQRFLNEGIFVRFWFTFLVIGWMALVSVFWQRQQERKEQEQRKLEAEKLAREAELHKLHQQLQPHFLFNSLNSINALVGNRPQEARKMIQQLSDFLRGTLRKNETDWVSLEEEMKHLQLYLDIEKVRFGHRLTACINYPENCATCQLPAMLLQPIVENAVKFGLYDTTESVSIHIWAQLSEYQLQVSVQNPFDSETASLLPGAGFGLRGVKRRLYLLFARNDLIETRSDGRLFTTMIKIPQR
jgi:hypothetical protein